MCGVVEGYGNTGNVGTIEYEGMRVTGVSTAPLSAAVHTRLLHCCRVCLPPHTPNICRVLLLNRMMSKTSIALD
jgi:hypothetical protein